MTTAIQPSLEEQRGAAEKAAAEGRREAAEKAAASYAWDYFQYHAGQRQAVFRFFVTLVGVLTLAYGYSLRSDGAVPANVTDAARLFIGILLVVLSFLFFRLDKRSQALIKNAEEALKKSEERTSTSLGGDKTIELMRLGDVKKGGLVKYWESFRQIYAWIFFLVGAAGAWMVARQLIAKFGYPLA
jgi:hypothetical protein